MKTNRFTLFLIAAFLFSACTVSIGSKEIIQGSGVAASETRSAQGFTSVELAGSAEVRITFGEQESVVVEADENLLPYITTKVSQGSLVIGVKSNTNLSTNLGIRVHVTMKRLEKAHLTGSGSIDVTGMQANTVKFDLPGSGNINASGLAETVNISLGGSGNILCGDVQAGSAAIQLSGSGNITVFASESLEATIQGSGNIRYRGSPAKVDKSVPGSGTIEPMQ
jgi:hypothetical protein